MAELNGKIQLITNEIEEADQEYEEANQKIDDCNKALPEELAQRSKQEKE